MDGEVVEDGMDSGECPVTFLRSVFFRETPINVITIAKSFWTNGKVDRGGDMAIHQTIKVSNLLKVGISRSRAKHSAVFGTATEVHTGVNRLTVW